MQKACKAVIKDADADAIDKIFSSGEELSDEDLQQLCRSKKFCTAKIEDLPALKDWKNEDFKEDSDAAIADLMDSMKGMPGMENMKMYKPDDLKSMVDNMKDDTNRMRDKEEM